MEGESAYIGLPHNDSPVLEDERNSSRHPKGDDMNYIKKPDWSMPEREATPESVFLNPPQVLGGRRGSDAEPDGDASLLA